MKEMIISSLVDVEFWATTVLGQWLCTSVGSSKTHTPFSICYFEVASGSILFYISTTVSLFPSFNRSLLVLCVCVCGAGGKVMMIELIPAPFATHFSCTHSPVCFVSLLLIQPTLLFSFAATPVCVYRHYATVYTTRQFNNARTRHKCTGTLLLWYFYWV